MLTKYISRRYLKNHTDHVFVFGDNLLRRGYAGGAHLRDCENSYGFITKKYPSYSGCAFYTPQEYSFIFLTEIRKLINEIKNNPKKTFLISQVGSGLANKYKIYEFIIMPGLKILKKYKNVKFLYGTLD